MKNKNTRLSFLILLVAAVVTLYTQLFRETLSPLLKKIVDKFFHGSDLLVIVLGLVLLSALLILTVWLQGHQESEKFDRQKILDKITKSIDNQIQQKLAEDMFYEITPNLQFSEIDLSDEMAAKLNKEVKDVIPSSFESLTSLFIEKLKKIIIIGEPGAGKSVILLKMHKKLIEVARLDDKMPIPLLFDLVSWNPDFSSADSKISVGQKFNNWLNKSAQSQLQSFGVGIKDSIKLVGDLAFIPLLDGFDEINDSREESDNRPSPSQYLLAIEGFVSNRKRKTATTYPELLLTCRTSVFRSLHEYDRRPPFNAVLHINPITDLKAELNKKSLEDPQGPAFSLLNSLEIYPHLLALLDTAFSVHMALKLAELEYSFNKITGNDELLNAYVTTCLESAKVGTNTQIKWACVIARRTPGLKFTLVDIYKYDSRYFVLELFKDILSFILCFFLIRQLWQDLYINGILLSNSNWPGTIQSHNLFLKYLFCLIVALIISETPSDYEKSVAIKRHFANLLKTLLFSFSCISASFIAQPYFPQYNLILWGSSISFLGCFFFIFKHLNIQANSFFKLLIETLFFSVKLPVFVIICVVISFIIQHPLEFSRATNPIILLKKYVILHYHLMSPIILWLSLACLVTSTLFRMGIKILIMGITNKLPFRVNIFLSRLKSSGLITKSGNTYRFRHLLIKEWFCEQIKWEGLPPIGANFATYIYDFSNHRNN